MFQPKPKMPAKRVWRISANAPRGAWVDVVDAAVPRPSADLPEVTYGSWVTSSYDLLDGADVTEVTDTMPGGMFDELFAPGQGARKSPGA
jgi:hypothetical protein